MGEALWEIGRGRLLERRRRCASHQLDRQRWPPQLADRQARAPLALEHLPAELLDDERMWEHAALTPRGSADTAACLPRMKLGERDVRARHADLVSELCRRCRRRAQRIADHAVADAGIARQRASDLRACLVARPIERARNRDRGGDAGLRPRQDSTSPPIA